MSRQRQRQRHLTRQPVEETVRLSLSDLVGDRGFVEVERHNYDWRKDDLLVWIHLKEPIAKTSLEVLRKKLAERMDALLPAGRSFEDWMIVAKCGGETVFTTASMGI